MENMMNRLFSHISSDESTLHQQNNEQSTKQPPKKGEDQKKSEPSENTNNIPIIIVPIIVQPSTYIKILGSFSIMNLQQVVSSTYEEAIKWKRNWFMLFQERPVNVYI